MKCEICPSYIVGFGCVAEDMVACLMNLLVSDDNSETL